ncbi:MAG: AmmeMemoRadiSam system protein B [Kofleriaceae bacterium]|nr:AmmeMemoRadiSam system protein B [Kofleriaceae bacterium]
MHARPPAVAGRFYPGSAAEVAHEVAQLYAGAAGGDVRAAAVMCPHAGWVYSGKLAAATLAGVHVPERVVVLCPNHTGAGARVAVMAEGAWQLPGAVVPIDAPLAHAILDEARAVRGVRDDARAHAGEHAIEVLLPLLLARQPALRIVPIVVGGLDGDECVALGQALARAVARAGDGADVLVVASSDMSHYLPDGEARRRDRLALDALVTGDAGALVDAVVDHDVSMCGVRPAAAMLAYARARGAALPHLVGYATSGDAFGDYDRVVGYAGVVVPAA